MLYIALALLALVPGVLGLANVQIGNGTLPGALYERLILELQDITFGGGLRFWLGVAGASMMSLLLLYPIRKALARRRGLGSIGGWFHIHILMGLFGPVLILYHCNFSHGALNANVALWTMLVVAGSGIAGHFVYARVSAGFYGDKRKARDHLDALIVAVRSLDGLYGAYEEMIERLERFETRMLAPRRGVVASVAARVRSTVHRHQFHRELSAVVAACAREQRWSPDLHRQRGRHLHALMKHYMDSVRIAAGRSVLEQLWARWRLFHLPVFLIMCAAVVLHVVAVWGIDAPAELTDAARGHDQIAQLLERRETAASQPEPFERLERGARPAPDVQTAVPANAADVVNPIETVLASEDGAVHEDVLARLLFEPVEIKTAPARSVPSQAAATGFELPVTGIPKLPASPQPAQAPIAQAPIVGPANVQPAASGPPAPKADESGASGIETTYAELRQRVELPSHAPPPMGLGAPRKGDGATVLSLTERLAQLKSERFDHNTTRFSLTGKHTKVDCAACHKTTIEHNPSTCVACHEKDEPHNGRRPDCAKCHTTNRWTQILRR